MRISDWSSDVCSSDLDRWGRKATLIGMAAAGALLSLVIGWSTALPTIVVLVLAFLYGFAALGDSGVLSTAMADAVPAGQLGRLLALRSILGFGAGALSPLAFGWILDLTNPPGALPSQWGWRSEEHTSELQSLM